MLFYVAIYVKRIFKLNFIIKMLIHMKKPVQIRMGCVYNI